ncbi:MAG: hypothetical protein EBU90_17740 [Proteobacteria bacterium]|nr:hypothetical protein [Pseudomonadota bacterium]
MLWNPTHLQFPITITDVVGRYQTFLCEFVDLKKNGYHHYTKACDNLTYGFWGPWLRDSDTYVTNFADYLKLAIKLK